MYTAQNVNVNIGGGSLLTKALRCLRRVRACGHLRSRRGTCPRLVAALVAAGNPIAYHSPADSHDKGKYERYDHCESCDPTYPAFVAIVLVRLARVMITMVAAAWNSTIGRIARASVIIVVSRRRTQFPMRGCECHASTLGRARTLHTSIRQSVDNSTKKEAVRGIPGIAGINPNTRRHPSQHYLAFVAIFTILGARTITFTTSRSARPFTITSLWRASASSSSAEILGETETRSRTLPSI